MFADTSQDTPIVFVLDDDVSVRESLELLIRLAGWEPEVFASAREFLGRPRVFTLNCLVLDVFLADLVKTAERLHLSTRDKATSQRPAGVALHRSAMS